MILFDNMHMYVTLPCVLCRYAIKFFTKRQGFERERKLYDKLALRSMMPAVIEVVPNADNRYATEDGFVFPPCLVVERGESLDEWARRIEPGFLTILSVRLIYKRYSNA